jgi:hypothetical protein
MTDAFSIAQQILEDHQGSSSLAFPGSDPASLSVGGDTAIHTPLQPEPEAGIPEMIARGLSEGTVIDVEAWRKIDEAEKKRAQAMGGEGRGKKERIKFRRVEDMLAVLS